MIFSMMNGVSYIILICFAVTFVSGLPNVIQYEMDKVLKNEEVDLGTLWNIYKAKERPSVKLQSFKWKDCGNGTSLAKITQLSLSPDPIATPGTLTITAEVKVGTELNNLKGTVEMYENQRGTWKEVPCIFGFGSCTYDDLCSLMSQVPCPPILTNIGLNCRCPIGAKTYSLKAASVDLMAAVFPRGDYHIKANVTDVGAGKQAICLDVFLSFA